MWWSSNEIVKELRSRIARIKAVPFEQSINAIASNCGIELPDLPGWICCPVHSERTPSLKVDLDYWYCHGACKNGGDALDFLQALEGLGLPGSVARLEGLLGLSEDAAEAAAARARAATARPSTERELEAWQRAIDEFSEAFLTYVQPYLHCPDPMIHGVAEGPADYVFEELRDAAAAGPPRVSRVRRERLRDLRLWSMGWAKGIERDVERITGRDRLDVAMQAGGRGPERIRREHEAIRPLIDALRAREREVKRLVAKGVAKT